MSSGDVNVESVRQQWWSRGWCWHVVTAGIWLEQIGMKRGFANVEMIRLPTAADLGVGGAR